MAYIEHPALLGARMANDMSKQRTQLVGQARLQGADYLNQAATRDANLINQVLLDKARLQSRMDASGAYQKDLSGVDVSTYGQQALDQVRQNMATRGGYNLAQNPEDINFYTGPSSTPAGEMALPQYAGQAGPRYTPEQMGLVRGPMSEQQMQYLGGAPSGPTLGGMLFQRQPSMFRTRQLPEQNTQVTGTGK